MLKVLDEEGRVWSDLFIVCAWRDGRFFTRSYALHSPDTASFT